MSKTVVVTGANRGIGLEFVSQLLAKGWQVFATARSPEKSSELAMLRERNPERLFIGTLDLENLDSISELPSSVARQFDKLDLLINNAGIYLDSAPQKLEDLRPDFMERSFRINTLGPVFVTQKLLPLLKKSENSKVVHITSQMGSIDDNSSGGAYSYRMSKAALNMFNKCVSIELKNILCLVLHPGWVQTDMGGKNALITPKQSVEGMLSLIEKATIDRTGHFYNYKGEELPW